jgi:signal transduction histidine kinase
MRFRGTRVRAKVTVLLLSMSALWIFAAWITLHEGVNLLWVSNLDTGVNQPSIKLIPELQRERLLTMTQMNRSPQSQREVLGEQRLATDKWVTTYLRLSDTGSVHNATTPVLERRLSETRTLLNGLAAVRKQIDSRSVTQATAANDYSQIIDAILNSYDALAVLDDTKLAQDSRDLIQLVRLREVTSQEDALMAGVMSNGKFSTAEQAHFFQLVGVRRYTLKHTLDGLSRADTPAFKALSSSEKLNTVTNLEDQVQRAKAGLRQPSAVVWTPALAAAVDEMEQIRKGAGDRLLERAKPMAIGVIVRLALAGGLGLIAVVSSIVLSVTTARNLVRQLNRLKTAAHELSDEKLPQIVERLGRGETVDVAAEAPDLEFGDDDIGQVGQAFNTVQKTAIKVAAEQAELRRSIRDILLSLARRSQALVHRQLTLLDTMERREIDTEELEDLFRIDHLATRMRRNAENLIILSGATASRGWRRPVPVVDVVRSAVAEVEDYTRVAVLPIGEVSVTGRAVGDISHLLAELIENAVSFSPPYTVAQISGHMVASGYAIEIEDRGLGMSDEGLEQINRRIADPPEFNLSSSAQLGLYVVGRLAERYQIQVTLKRSPYGGTTAVIVIPRELIEEGDADDPTISSEPQLMSVGATTVHEYSKLSLIPGPEPHQPEPEPVPATESSTTPSGLPMRVPQASLAAPLREEPSQPEVMDDDPGRSPEEIRKIVGAFKSGAQRGRSDANASEQRESETE